jgi:hypothetical protein
MPAQVCAISSCRMPNSCRAGAGWNTHLPPRQDLSALDKTECFAQESAYQSARAIRRLFGLTNFTRCPLKTHRSFVPKQARLPSLRRIEATTATKQLFSLGNRDRGRDGSDTVLHIIGSYFCGSWQCYRALRETDAVIEESGTLAWSTHGDAPQIHPTGPP